MENMITNEIILHLQHELEHHPVYEAIRTVDDLQCFMEHHVYSVWDFMSIIKYLQSKIAPTEYPWTPQHQGSIRRLINELVLEEESDETNVKGEYSSHFELYQKAMTEIQANTEPSTQFVRTVQTKGIDQALQLASIPEPSRKFTATTFALIHSNQPHQVAAILTFGREHIVPSMFRSFLAKMKVSEAEAPIFHYYLKRHVHLDEDFHAPLSLRLLNDLCENEPMKIEAAVETAKTAITARIEFWDGVLSAISHASQQRYEEV